MPSGNKITGVFLSIRGGLARSIASIVPPKEVEDIVQETYVRVCQNSPNKTIMCPRSFMYKTARNIALNHVNKAETRLVLGFDDFDVPYDESHFYKSSSNTLDNICSDEEFSLFCKAVRTLPKQCRRVFVLKKVYGHTQREISSRLNISEKTVEKHVSNGLKKCRAYMRKDEMINKPRHKNAKENIG